MAPKSKLAYLMLDKGISGKQLAVKTGLSETQIVHLKRGFRSQIRVSTIERVCRVLGCQPWDVIEWEVTND
jgi:putative transcriptional regulator